MFKGLKSHIGLFSLGHICLRQIHDSLLALGCGFEAGLDGEKRTNRGNDFLLELLLETESDIRLLIKGNFIAVVVFEHDLENLLYRYHACFLKVLFQLFFFLKRKHDCVMLTMQRLFSR